jgi:hypothetical protein
MIPITLRSNFEINSKQVSIIFRYKEELKKRDQTDPFAQDNCCA